MNAPHKLTVHFSSASDDWPTPQNLFDALDTEFDFTLDPAATVENAKCAKYYTREQNGLSKDWAGETVFLNPPYGRGIGQWVSKAYETALTGSVVVCLLPSRTDTSWWHRYCARGEIRLLKGRLKFGGAKHCAPFPSAIVVFRPWAQPVRHVEI
jgi:phage N-6-adenine-methyltransferase